MQKIVLEPFADMQAHVIMSFMLRQIGLIFVAVVVGWVFGSIFPFGLWPHSDCHHLGGAIRVVAGPGKATECVIPWD